MSEFAPKNILVTGGAGFIGCNYVRYMLKSDSAVKIINLDALTYAGSLNNLQQLPDRSRHTFVQGDIGDRALIDTLMRQYNIDTIVHFAAESHVDNSISNPEIFIKTNIVGTFTLLEAARQYWLVDSGASSADRPHCRFHHISTDEVYGTLAAGERPFSETTPYAPNSPYSASKAGSDHMVRAYFHTYGLPVTTTNCSNNYGAYQHDEKFIPTVIRSCLQGKPIPIYGDGTNIRDWLYVRDHCSAIDAVVRRGELGEVYNIGGINEWTNIDICRLICQLMDEHRPEQSPHSQLITFVEDRAGHDWRYAIDARKVADRLGWRPTETFESGIRETVSWYLNSYT
ncbi:MAG: dTDP-glucose 4,6-dehydratase [Mariprofundales bacterium]|nr:dTDP-glucose 4,6-dehydratase [Mariprofundales bacterium]